MRATASVLVATFVLAAFAETGCHRRKPLPRKPDAGPVVEMVEARPLGQPSAAGSTAPATPLADEHEPNDDPEHAQLLSAGQGIRGSLAAPTSLGAGKGDDDYFILHTEATRQQLRIEATSGPMADLQLELLSGAGQRLALADERGRGEGELIQNLALAPSQTFYVRVRGSVAAAGKTAADYGYALTITAAPAPPGGEQEPNDTPQLASPAVGVDLSGALSFRRDEDYWFVSLPEAVGRRVNGADDALSGLRAPAVLRVELLAPGVVPSVRVLVQAAPPARPAAELDGGAAVADGGVAAAPVLTPLVEVVAGKGVSELRLRNLTVPAGSARAYIAVRGQSFSRPPGEARYHLRLTVEPELEDAEIEPNDDCAQATPLKLGAVGSGRGEGDIAGFLWPGDVDCYRLQPPSASPTRWQLKLALPGGDCQAALDLVRGGDSAARATPDGSGGLELRTKGELVLRVSSRDRKTCFEAPYRLTARTEPDAPAAPAGRP